MNCVWFHRRLHSLLDRRIAPETDAELVEHAWHCAECRQELKAHQDLLEILASSPSDAPSDLADRVVRAGVGLRPRRKRRSWRAIAAVAAALLLVIGIPGIYRITRPAPGTAQVAVRPSPPDPSSPATLGIPLAGNYRHLLTALAAQLDDVESLESVDHIAGGLRPITISFGVAIDALRKSLPLKNKADERPDKQARTEFATAYA